MKHGGGQHTTKGRMFVLIFDFQWVPGSRGDTDGKHTDGVLDFHTQKTFDLRTVADPMGGGSLEDDRVYIYIILFYFFLGGRQKANL